MKAQQLKNAILQLAIQGKLVPQDPNDEPASELLCKIQAEKDRLIAEGKIKKSKKAADKAPYTIEPPFEIPETWEWVRLGDYLDVRDGTHDTPKYVDNGYPLITSKNLDNGKINFDNVKYISEEDHKSISLRSKVDVNDILFAMIGSIGNPVIVKDNVEFSIKNVALFKPLLPNTEMKYIFHILSFYQKEMKDIASGGVQSFVSLSLLRNFIIPIPPFPEQHRIVQKIEELLPLVEQYNKTEQKLTALNRNFPEQLKKSILQAAIQGKLTEQNPNDEPAFALIERIKAEKNRLIAEKKLKKPKSVAEIVMRDNLPYEIKDGVERCIADEVPFEIPENWCWVRLGEAVQINPRNSIDDELPVSFVPMNSISGGYSYSHTSQIRKWKEIKSGFTHFANDDIGIAKITPCFENRKSAIFSNLENGCGSGTTELFILRPFNKTVFNKYLLWFSKSFYFINNGIKTYTGTAGQQRISSKYIQDCLFPIPPLNEQHRIVQKIEELFKEIERL